VLIALSVRECGQATGVQIQLIIFAAMSCPGRFQAELAGGGYVHMKHAERLVSCHGKWLAVHFYFQNDSHELSEFEL